jgi:zeaxanthin glucosyltransferase
LKRAGASWVCAFAPQREVLARADAVVSHAGLNTVLDAIAARTPILALPIAFDQPGMAAARILHAGIGLRASPRLAGAATLERQLRACSMSRSFGSRLEALAQQLDRPAARRARPTSSKRHCACAAAKTGAQPAPKPRPSAQPA